ncbi:hypothetical protein LguiB_009774 [Lonicera macranthoides]
MESWKILVFGGTGYIGRHIVKASVLYGHPTYVYTRPNSSQLTDILQDFQAMGVILIKRYTLSSHSEKAEESENHQHQNSKQYLNQKKKNQKNHGEYSLKLSSQGPLFQQNLQQNHLVQIAIKNCSKHPGKRHPRQPDHRTNPFQSEEPHFLQDLWKSKEYSVALLAKQLSILPKQYTTLEA